MSSFTLGNKKTQRREIFFSQGHIVAYWWNHQFLVQHSALLTKLVIQLLFLFYQAQSSWRQHWTYIYKHQNKRILGFKKSLRYCWGWPTRWLTRHPGLPRTETWGQSQAYWDQLFTLNNPQIMLKFIPQPLASWHLQHKGIDDIVT